MHETRTALAGITQDILTLSLPDGRLTVDSGTMTAVETLLLQHGPDMVISHYMDTTGTDHNDHRVVGTVVRNVCYRKPFVKTFLSCEPLRPHTDFMANLFVDISDLFGEKCAAIGLHESQIDRFYLSEAYHRVRGSRWFELADADNSPAIYEAYRLEKMVVPCKTA